jgi:hypothetical protein
VGWETNHHQFTTNSDIDMSKDSIFLYCWFCFGKVSGPAASAYKGYRWSKEKAEYLSSRGLINASYTINAADFREDLLGTLVPCTFQVKW